MFYLKLCIIPSMAVLIYFIQYLIYLLYSIFGLNNLTEDTDDLNLYKEFKVNNIYTLILLTPFILWVFDNITLQKCLQIFLINTCFVYILMLIFKSKKVNCKELINNVNSSIKIELLYNTNKTLNNQLCVSGLTIIEGRKENNLYSRFFNLKHLNIYTLGLSNIVNQNNVFYSASGSFFSTFDDAFLYLMNTLLKNRNERELLKNEFKNLYLKFNPTIDFYDKFDFSEQLIIIKNNYILSNLN